MQDWCSLSEAAVRLRTAFPDLVGDIRLGRLVRVGKYLQRSGFASVLVNLGHVGQEAEATSLDAFAYSQGLRLGGLLTFVCGNDVSRRAGREVGATADERCRPRGIPRSVH